MLSLHQAKIKNRIGITSNPLYFIKECHSGERHGPAEWQYDHWKATDATRGVNKIGYKSIAHRWLTDPRYQDSQWSHGSTLEYCKYQDDLKTVSVDHVASWDERGRYQNMLVVRYKDGKNPGKMSRPDVFQTSGHLLWPDTRKVE